MPNPFSQYGIEIELMIVDQTSLSPFPIADKLLKNSAGDVVNSLEHGAITWSNELVMHVLEFKTTKPVTTLDGLSEQFHRSIMEADQKLASLGGRLLGSAMHPWYTPANGTQLWLHDDREIYDTFNRIFDCRGHGWSNLQSFHLNLPFEPGNDDDFRRLHSAIRLVLPLIPALAASSPLVEGNRSEFVDTRVETYSNNCKRLPSVTGGVIPEVYHSQADYEERVFGAIARELEPHDPERLLEPIWTNARGAIARFDRGSIEIRVGDVQECPAQDLAILQFIIHLVRTWFDEASVPLDAQEKVSTDALRALLKDTTRHGAQVEVTDLALLRAYGQTESATVGKILRQALPSANTWTESVELILKRGNLAERILSALNSDYSADCLKVVYEQLADCLRSNKPFLP